MAKQNNFTDLGNSERFLRDHAANIKYCAQLKHWLAWDENRWVVDIGDIRIQTMAKNTAKALETEAKGLDDLGWALKSQTIGRINAMVKLARSAPEIQIQPDQLDANQWLLNCSNGTLDLRTGNLTPHSRDDLLTRITTTPYIPDAECPRFLRFLDEIMAGSQNKISFLQRDFGYALTGSTSEQCLFFFIGHGSNGKTTLIETVRKPLGPYAAHTPTATLLKTNQQIRNDLARLNGARFVTASEITKGKELDEATAKMLTGEDPVTSRFLYKEFFEYRPSFKLFLLANHTPEIKGTDFGIWRRIIMLPFPVTFSGERVDKNLSAKLEEEQPGILSWMVQGCLNWQKEGLNIPPEVKVATEDYRQETDIIPQFLADRCVLDKNSRVSSKDLYEAYKAWADENTDEILKKKALGTLLKVAGFKPSKSNGVRYWNGLKFRPGSSIQGVDGECEEPQSQAAGVGPTFH